MTDKTTELLESAKAVMPYLEASNDKRDRMLAIETSEDVRRQVREDFDASLKLSQAEKLRREADEIEAKDAAILRFRAAVAAFE